MQTCYHCAQSITPAQPRIVHRSPSLNVWPRVGPAFWQVFHADCYLRAEEQAALALGVLPENLAPAVEEARTRVALAWSAQS